MSYQPQVPPEYGQPQHGRPPQPLGYAPPLSYASDEVAIDPGNPWAAISTRPKDVMRWVLANDPTKWVPGLIFGGSLVGAIGRIEEGKGASAYNAGFIVGAIVGGAAIGFIISYFVAPLLLNGIAGWIGGQGDRIRTRAALAYAQIPTICAAPVALAMAILVLVMEQQGAAAGGAGGVNIGLALVVLALALVQIVVAIWGVIIFVHCFAVAQRFSSWRSLGAIALTFAVLIGVVLAIAIPVALVAGR